MEIPECLVADILVRLPIKSILRFKSVCKSWYAFLSNPEFLFSTNLFTVDPDDQMLYKNHPNQEVEVSLVSFNNLDHISPTQKLPRVSHGHHLRYTRIAGCCNGIVLLQNGMRMCLWNPETEDTKFPPESNLVRSRFHEFDGDWHNVGFCFDAKTSDFKVILIFDPTNADGIDCVYSLKSDSWRIVEPQSPRAKFCGTDNTAMNSSSGNMCHWFGIYLAENNYEEVILSFDANREMFKTTSTPYGRKGVYIPMDYNQSFFMLKDCVAMYSERENGTKMYEIWAMLEVGVKESWIKVLTIGPIGPFRKVLRFWTDKKLFFFETNGVRGDGGSEDAVVVFDTFTGQTSTFLHRVNMPQFILATNYKKSQVQLEELSTGANQLH